MALAMVDSSKLTVVRPSFGVDSTGRRPPRRAAMALIYYTNSGSGPDEPRFTVTVELTITQIVSVRAIVLLVSKACAKPHSVLFEDDEVG